MESRLDLARKSVERQRRRRQADLDQPVATLQKAAFEVYGEDTYGKHITYNAYEDAKDAYTQMRDLRKTFPDQQFGVRPVEGTGQKKVDEKKKPKPAPGSNSFKKSVDACSAALEDRRP